MAHNYAKLSSLFKEPQVPYIYQRKLGPPEMHLLFYLSISKSCSIYTLLSPQTCGKRWSFSLAKQKLFCKQINMLQVHKYLWFLLSLANSLYFSWCIYFFSILLMIIIIFILFFCSPAGFFLSQYASTNLLYMGFSLILCVCHTCYSP